ncbi:MAG: hypothetical protein JWP35_4101 [Caulobacter sp.]|nr:hypothetical protein [Caulobacter sp.]
MTEAFRRAIRVWAKGDEATCELEDSFHRFGVTVRHDGARITEVEARAGRYPWSTCPMAAVALKELTGMEITTDPTVLYRFADAREHCTHQFETLGLAVTQAARGDGERRYEAEVADEPGGPRRARLWTDGALVLDWTVVGGVIAPPSPQAGRRPSSFGSRGVEGLPHDEAEALLILRRGDFLARGLTVDVDSFASAADYRADGICFSYQPERAAKALRVHGSHRDFQFGDGPKPAA